MIVVPVAAVPAMVPAFDVRATWRRGYLPVVMHENGVAEVTLVAKVTPLPEHTEPA
jgi:hypothetical protein